MEKKEQINSLVNLYIKINDTKLEEDGDFNFKNLEIGKSELDQDIVYKFLQ